MRRCSSSPCLVVREFDSSEISIQHTHVAVMPIWASPWTGSCVYLSVERSGAGYKTVSSSCGLNRPQFKRRLAKYRE